MLDKHALFFVKATGALTEFKFVCAELERVAPNAPMTPNLQKLVNHALHSLRHAYILSDLGHELAPLDRLENSANPKPGYPVLSAATIGNEVKHLLPIVRDKLDAEYYFHVDQRDVPHYVNKELFGSRVTKKFPKATEDIEEAGKCVALQRPTAAVFYLMRVMEAGVQRLGTKMKIALNPKEETWYQIMEHVDGAIKKLPAKTTAEKSKKAKLAAASANLNAVRIASRNEVMHPKQTYTRDQALDVFIATRAFMDHLAGLI